MVEDGFGAARSEEGEEEGEGEEEKEGEEESRAGWDQEGQVRALLGETGWIPVEVNWKWGHPDRHPVVAYPSARCFLPLWQSLGKQ